MTFNLTPADNALVKSHLIMLDRVDDVGMAPGTQILFQFPPTIKGDRKEGKWSELYNTLGYEPKYQYQGAMPRSITLEAVYVVGGPPIGGGGGGGGIGKGATIAQIQTQIRVWKKYFYLKSLGEAGGQGKSLPIWRISYMGGSQGFITRAQQGSAWRCINYNIKYSDEWITESGRSHPLVSTITVELQLSTKVDVALNGDPKQPHENLDNVAVKEWY